MDEVLPIEIRELDAERFVQLEGERRWPKYVLLWSVRQRSGDTDFPVARGEIERMPPRDGDLDSMWEEMKTEAWERAQAVRPDSPEGRPSLLSRLFGRTS